MKALVGAFNQEKALVGAFSVIVQPVVGPMEHYTALLTILDTGVDAEYCFVVLLATAKYFANNFAV